MNGTPSNSRPWSGVHVHARTAGSGDPCVVFVHGWATTSAVWDPVLQKWPRGGGTAHTLDLPGVGKSDRPGGYTLERWARAVGGYIEALDAPVVLVGHSMGGTIAQRVALDLPQEISRLVLVSPVPASGVALPPDAIELFQGMVDSPTSRSELLSTMMVAPVQPAAFDAFAAASADVSAAAFLDGLHAWRTADFAPALRDLTVPTHVISGAEEQPLTPAFLRGTVLQQLPHATHTVLAGVGHYPQYEAIERFLPTLMAAIRA